MLGSRDKEKSKAIWIQDYRRQHTPGKWATFRLALSAVMTLSYPRKM